MENYVPVDTSLPFILCTAGRVPKQRPFLRDPGPTWNQIIWVTDGGARFTVGDAEFMLSEGEGVFMRHSVPHSYSGEDFSTAYVTFFCTESLLTYFFGENNYHIFKTPDFLERELDELCRFACTKANKSALSAAGYTFVTELLSAVTENCDNIVEKVRVYLTDHLSEPVQLDDVAAHVGLDRFSLCRYFTKNHTCTVMSELKAMRIAKAKQLLRYSSESIENIAVLCGFESPSYFSLRFREQCACTPTEYRKQRL